MEVESVDEDMEDLVELEAESVDEDMEEIGMHNDLNGPDNTYVLEGDGKFIIVRQPPT